MLLAMLILGVIILYDSKGKLSNKKVSFSAKKFLIPRSLIAFYLITLILVCVAGFRYDVGADFRSYYNNFTYYADDSINIFKENEIAIRIIAKIASSIGTSAQIYIFICSAITVFLFMVTIKRYSDNVVISCFLYVFLGMFLGSFNAVRQYLACSVIFFSMRYIFEECWKKWIIGVVCAFFCHTSAIILLPLYWLVRIKDRKKFIIIAVMLSVIAFFSYDRIFALIDQIKGNVNRSVADRIYAQNSVNFFRVLVSWAPVALCYFPKNVLEVENIRDAILFKFVFLAAALQTVSMNSTYLARFCTYTTATGILSIPALIKYQSQSNRRILIPLILILYFIYWTAEATGPYTINYQMCL